jgi:hypothetical protein
MTRIEEMEKENESLLVLDTLNREISQLHLRLRFADAVYIAALAQKNVELQQWAVGQAIAAAVQFGDHLAGKPTAALVGLLQAWCDLEEGHADEILKPVAKRGGPKLRFSEAEFRFYAALAMEQYLRSGLSRNDAAKRVATKLSNKGYRFRGSGRAAAGAEQVKHWRDSPKVTDERLATHLSQGDKSLQAGDVTIMIMPKLFPRKFETDT